jgi:site-specific DNA-cytosine methylase
MSEVQALGVHVFMGGMTRGLAEALDVQAQLEVFDLGELTVEHNLQIPFYQGEFQALREIAADKYPHVPVVYGNPRCTGFSPLGHGCSEDAHGAWSKPTVDIRQLAEIAALIRPRVWGFESVQQAGTTGRDLIEWLDQNYGKGYRRAELYHNAAQFGNAQHRRRVIFLWYADDLKLPVEEVTSQWIWRGDHATTEDALRGRGAYGDMGLWDLWDLEAKNYPNIDGFDTIAKVEAASPWIEGKHDNGDVIGMFPVLNHWYKTVTDPYLECSVKLVKEGHSMNGLPEAMLEEHGYDEFAEKKSMDISFSWHAPRKLHRKKACPVIYSASGKFMHPAHARPLTVRELARIMGFDDSWAVLGPDPIAQLGKGICVHVGRWLGHLIKACVTGSVTRNNDFGLSHEIFRLDTDYGWTPKKPRVVVEGYAGYEEDD